ncbi:5-bromo-4-chloroindolyl phosphate hydrolysis family protein [Thiohalocapsa halophila]
MSGQGFFGFDYRHAAALGVGLLPVLATDPALPLPAPFPAADALALSAIAVTAYAGTFLALPAPGALALRRARRAVRGSPDQQARVAQTIVAAQPVVARIRDAAGRLEAPLADSVLAVAASADGILEALAADPSDLRRSRRLLDYYLPELADLTERYLAVADKRRLAGRSAGDVLDKYRLVVADMHRLLARQAEQNLADDLLALDVGLDVPRKSVSYEGI